MPENSEPGGVAGVLNKIEDGLLVGLLAAMILLAVFQIISRNIFGVGYSWTDVLIRVLVLWIGLVGAMIASRTGEHISIDVISRFLPDRAQLAAAAATQMLTVFVCGLVAWHGARFVKMEYEFGAAAFADIPVWVCELIIPFSFTVIALRYLVLSIHSIFRLVKRRP